MPSCWDTCTYWKRKRLTGCTLTFYYRQEDPTDYTTTNYAYQGGYICPRK